MQSHSCTTVVKVFCRRPALSSSLSSPLSEMDHAADVEDSGDSPLQYRITGTLRNFVYCTGKNIVENVTVTLDYQSRY